jgi:hypothetical protein
LQVRFPEQLIEFTLLAGREVVGTKINLDLIQRTAENEWRLIVIAHGRASVAASLLGEISLIKLIAAGLIFAL